MSKMKFFSISWEISIMMVILGITSLATLIIMIESLIEEEKNRSLKENIKEYVFFLRPLCSLGLVYYQRTWTKIVFFSFAISSLFLCHLLEVNIGSTTFKITIGSFILNLYCLIITKKKIEKFSSGTSQ